MMPRKWLVPEVVQTSSIDCGPACLNALLGGFGFYVSYGRLREACQTSIDGTSIDTIEALTNRLGLVAEQIVLPADHVPLREAAALPAIAVVRLPTGMTHFVILWRRHGSRLQIMDPAAGRQWIPIAAFAKRLYMHQMEVPTDAWRQWAGSAEFTGGLAARLREIGASAEVGSRLIDLALADSGWRGLATLDAATRLVGSLIRSGALPKGSRASRLLGTVLERALANPDQAEAAIPSQYWSVWPAQSEGVLVTRGAVLVRIKARSAEGIDRSALPPEIVAAVQERPPRVVHALWQLLKQDGSFAPAITAGALFTATIGVLLQALVFRALMQGGRELAARGARLGAVTAVLLLLLILVAVEIPAAAALLAMGRRLEIRFRTALLQKLPRIAEQYFHSRPVSDMAERSHNLHYLRVLPNLAGQMLRSGFELVLTAAGVVWIDPHLWPLALLSVFVAVALPAAIQPILSERAVEVRTHAGALSRFYLDSLLGLVPIRAHVADNVVRVEHRALLTRWATSAWSAQRAGVVLEGLQMGVGFGLAALLTISHLARYPESAAVLLLAFWSLNLPMIGRELVAQACEYPVYRNIALRLMEPLAAIERPRQDSAAPVAVRSGEGPVAIALRDVAVVAGGHQVLQHISLEIGAGSHVAIVGPSGAGKSTLAALLLGWRSPSSGELTIDGQSLTEAALDELRRTSAWVDPSVHLWNASLLDNLRYGLESEPSTPLGEAADQAELSSAIERLPEGFETVIGDNGALLSEGEGQRVRLARALLRPAVRLAVLDEPFRGLDGEMRQRLLDRVRSHWRNATLVMVTHDVASTLSFDRVLVMEGGTVAEDGPPAKLASIPNSRYTALLREETELKSHLLLASDWRRLRMERGTISEQCETLQLAAPAPSSEAVVL